MKTILEVQKFWNERPCNRNHSVAPVNSEQYHDEVSARKYFVEPHIPEFAEFPKWAGKAVLEIGCGIGTDTINFSKAGAWVHALDVSQASLDIARTRATTAREHINFFLGNAEELDKTPAWNCDYDLVYAFGSIHHSPNPEAILHNIRFVTHPGSIVKLMVYNKYSWKSLWVLLKYGHGKFWKFDELIARYSEAQTGCPITHTFSKRSLRAMLERNGFHVRKMYKAHIFPYKIDDYKNYRYVKCWYWQWMPEKLFKFLERNFGWHLLVEATV